MTNDFSLTERARLLVLALGLCLAAMLVASLADRFTSSGLTVRHAPESAAQGPASGNDEVGRLMQEISRDPNNKAALIAIAERLMGMGSWDGAESFVNRALALDSKDARARYLLGVIRHNQGKHDEAARLLEEALKTREDPSMRYSLGVLYIHYLGEPARGVEQLNQALKAPGLDESLRQSIREELEKAPQHQEKARAAEAKVQNDKAQSAKAQGEKAQPEKRGKSAPAKKAPPRKAAPENSKGAERR